MRCAVRCIGEPPDLEAVVSLKPASNSDFAILSQASATVQRAKLAAVLMALFCSPQSKLQRQRAVVGANFGICLAANCRACDALPKADADIHEEVS